MTDVMDERGGVILDGPFDPDAQATVTDYIDYTEYLPADLIRSLTLIRGLDERYPEATQAVHELTRVYGHLPDLPVDERPNAQDLRSQISQKLDYAVNARESSYAEACRLYDVVDRHFDRLDCIRQKLHALPRPVSEKKSPPAEVAGAKRTRTGKKGEPEGTTTRITLRLDASGTDSPGTQKGRRRRATITEGRLARLHPDSPIASTEHSDAEAESKVTRSTTLTDLEGDVKAAKTKKDKSAQRARSSLPASKPNRSVAPMSTSSALALLNPPPENAQPGSADLPWLRLTDWEMTMLRKKMKKNAVWQPSEVMVHRELALSGRGWEAYLAAKAEAEKTGAEFIDCDDVMNTYVPGKLTKRTDGSQGEVLFPTETTLSNRGMKLNEAKKLKRENLAREQAAAAAAEAELAARRLGAVGSTFKSLFSSPGSDSAFATATTRSRTDNIQGGDRSSRKRKLDESTLVDTKVPMVDADASQLRSSTTKRKSTQGSNTITLTATGAQNGNQRSSRPSPSGAALTSTRVSKRATATPTPPITVSSRRRSAAASVEPVGLAAAVAGRGLRPKSATPARRTPDISHPSSVAGATATGQRRKRPAPGIVQSGLDGGAAISHGRRKAKPTKKKVSELREPGSIDGRGTPSQDIRIDEDGVPEEIDPNEPRYCLCGDVSFGTMICCENPDCDKEWFHLACVGLTEVPSRTAKWYCPDCRPKFSRGADGIVRTGSRR